VDLETLYTSPQGFGIESATFMQRCVCRIFDGVPLDDLLARGTEFERQCLRTAIGCDPSELPVGGPPVEVCDTGPVRTGKSVRFAALCTARSQTIDPGIVKAGEEPPRISVLAMQLDQATTLRGHLNVVLERPLLRKLVIGEDSDSITLRHPSGLPIQIRVIAASRGGYSLASRWAGTVIFDEAPGWQSTDKIVSLEDSADQALSRLLPGGQVIYGGSVWQPSGKVHQLDLDNYGKPSRDVVVWRPRSVDGVTPAEQLNPAHWTPARVAQMRKTRSFRMHVLNEYGTTTGVFDEDLIASATTPLPNKLTVSYPFTVLDFSGGRGDATAWGRFAWCWPEAMPRFMSVRKYLPGTGHFWEPILDGEGKPIPNRDYQPLAPILVLSAIQSVRGAFGRSVSSAQLIERIARDARAWGCGMVIGDQFSSYALESSFAQYGLRFQSVAYTSPSKVAGVERLRRWFADGSIRIPPRNHNEAAAELHKELALFAEKPLPGGSFGYSAPAGQHDDHVALLLTCAIADAENLVPAAPTAPRQRQLDAASTRTLRAYGFHLPGDDLPDMS
jgi:hypothetical protein